MSYKRHQKKSEDTIARVKNTNQAIRHRNEKAEEWMKREPYGGLIKHEQNTEQKVTDQK